MCYLFALLIHKLEQKSLMKRLPSQRLSNFIIVSLQICWRTHFSMYLLRYATDFAQLNHGLEITQDGKTIFVSSIASVFAYSYDAAAGTVGAKKAVITGMSIPGPYHLTRTLRIPKSHPDILLVQRGSDGNIDSSTVQASSGKSQVRIFNISSILATPVAYASSGEVLGMGLRNSVGWAQHPITNHIVSISSCRT